MIPPIRTGPPRTRTSGRPEFYALYNSTLQALMSAAICARRNLHIPGFPLRCIIGGSATLAACSIARLNASVSLLVIATSISANQPSRAWRQWSPASAFRNLAPANSPISAQPRKLEGPFRFSDFPEPPAVDLRGHHSPQKPSALLLKPLALVIFGSQQDCGRSWRVAIAWGS